MNRQLISYRFPYLPINVQVRQLEEDVEALLDTGFDGYDAVPAGFFPTDEPPDLSVSCVLADDSVVLAPAYYGTVRLGSFVPFVALIAVLGSELLVGRDSPAISPSSSTTVSASSLSPETDG